MSNITESNVIEIGTNVKHTPLEYVYVTIPAEYICVYHRILAMLADYGEEMLKDCKAACKDRNSGVIECFNMFNAAVAAKKLNKQKLADTLIKYIKSKINQIYKGQDNSTSFVFPVDENGELKAYVSCGETPRFFISPDDGELYEHKLHNGFDEHFGLSPEDFSAGEYGEGLNVEIEARYETVNGTVVPCADIKAYYNNSPIDLERAIVNYYFDDVPVIRFNDVVSISDGPHKFTVVVKYNEAIDVKEVIKELS